ncbi:Histidine phosphatase [Parasponia andersonii]|uniref:Histidine phosphatase n=1 Tax=Parasponia andersonii TaxID=3476 RepID=A0A2P5CYW7_PARAD|nr:Histidine phosphatase [Parasponia andersonii]
MMSTTSFLRNRCWVLRHGKSIPNEKGPIVSSMELKENNIPLEKVRICYSPFSRTTHTAEVVASVLNIPFEGAQCKVMEDLRERYFGPSFELEPHDKFAQEICALHEKDPSTRPEGGESVYDIVARLIRALATIEAQSKGCTILIVSHGDPLQILQTTVHAAKQHTGTGCDDLESRIQAIRTPPILSQHWKFALLTGELWSVI